MFLQKRKKIFSGERNYTKNRFNKCLLLIAVICEVSDGICFSLHDAVTLKLQRGNSKKFSISKTWQKRFATRSSEVEHWKQLLSKKIVSFSSQPRCLTRNRFVKSVRWRRLFIAAKWFSRWINKNVNGVAMINDLVERDIWDWEVIKVKMNLIPNLKQNWKKISEFFTNFKEY